MSRQRALGIAYNLLGCGHSATPLGHLSVPTPYACHLLCSRNLVGIWAATYDALLCPTALYASGSLRRTCNMILLRKGSGA